MTFDLLWCGLPDVDDRQALAMLPVDFFLHDAASTRHKCLLGKRHVSKLSQSHLASRPAMKKLAHASPR
jgi:hypothetical protein